MFELLRKGRPGAPDQEVLDKFSQIIESGMNLPSREAAQTLYKITQSKKPHELSEYFTTAGSIRKMRKSGQTIADYFGLQSASEAPIYNLFKMQPSTPASSVFRSTIAPATDNALLQHLNQPYI